METFFAAFLFLDFVLFIVWLILVLLKEIMIEKTGGKDFYRVENRLLKAEKIPKTLKKAEII